MNTENEYVTTLVLPRTRRTTKVKSVLPAIEPPVVVEPPAPTWRERLAKSKIGIIPQMLLTSVVEYCVNATEEWNNSVQGLVEAPEAKLSKEEKLKHFFATNPFGCRNQKMLELLSILMDVPKKAITPALIDGDQTGDGSADGLNIGFMSTAKSGTAIKVIGGLAGDRKTLMSNAVGDIFFVRSDHNILGRGVSTGGDYVDINYRKLILRISPMPEHYRAATPDEILDALLKLDYDNMPYVARTIMNAKEYEKLMAPGN
jgi:hypothetical protein